MHMVGEYGRPGMIFTKLFCLNFYTVLRLWKSSKDVRKMKSTGDLSRPYCFFEIVRNCD